LLGYDKALIVKGDVKVFIGLVSWLILWIDGMAKISRRLENKPICGA
jgi:hypothetical protein